MQASLQVTVCVEVGAWIAGGNIVRYLGGVPPSSCNARNIAASGIHQLPNACIGGSVVGRDNIAMCCEPQFFCGA
jgi:hypothetical protein